MTLATLYATIALAKWLHTVARSAEVEELRMTVRNAWRVGMDICKPPSPEDKRRAIDALDRLAQLACDER